MHITEIALQSKDRLVFTVFYRSFVYNLSCNSNFSNYHDGRFKVPFNYTQLQVKYRGLPSETAGNLCTQKILPPSAGNFLACLS